MHLLLADATQHGHNLTSEWLITGAVCCGLLILTIIGCTWKISGRLAGMETALAVNTTKVAETHAMVLAHAKECDVDRAKTNQSLDTHGKRLDGLEACGT